MDSTIVAAIIGAIATVVAALIGAGILFSRRKKAETTRPGIKAEDLTSVEGGIKASDSTGSGVDAKKLNAKKDIDLSSRSPKP